MSGRSIPLRSGPSLPFTLYIDDRPVRVEGVVLYSYSFGEGPLKEPGMGVKFLSLSTEDRDLLRRFIRDHLNA